MSFTWEDKKPENNETDKIETELLPIDTREIRRLLGKLRNGKEVLETEKSNLSGLVGNIIGELKRIEYAANIVIHRNARTADIQKIIDEYNNDPVIRAYLDQREDWVEKLEKLKSAVRSFAEDFDDD